MLTFQIETARLILRDFRSEDWVRVHAYASIPEFSQYESWGPNTVEQTKIFVAEMMANAVQRDRREFGLAICRKSDGLLIGGCDLRNPDPTSRTGALGWAIHPDFQNQGFATEAAQALIRFGFEQLALLTIYATCDTRNLASARVMEKLKMQRVALIKGDKMQKGYLRDSYRYELAAHESAMKI
jgi:ribosomal-protein-alanine N-acetyltransferase